MLERRQFDDETLALMDDIARLLHIKISMRGMNESFKKAPGLDARAAKKPADSVIKATRAAAEDLLKQAFLRNQKRRIRETELQHVPKLKAALECAVRLSQQEYEATPEVAGKGVLDLHVLRPLRELTERWQRSLGGVASRP